MYITNFRDTSLDSETNSVQFTQKKERKDRVQRVRWFDMHSYTDA